MKYFWIIIGLLSLLLSVHPVSANHAPSFQRVGDVQVDVQEGLDWPNDMRLDAQGRVLLGGTCSKLPWEVLFPGSPIDYYADRAMDGCITRLTMDGMQDTSFAQSGSHIIGLRPSLSSIIRVLPTYGNQLIGVASVDDLSLVSLSDSGDAVPFFPLPRASNSHERIHLLGQWRLSTQDAVTLGDGSLYIAGTARPTRVDYSAPLKSGLFIAKVLPNGSMDPSFGLGGMVVVEQYADNAQIILTKRNRLLLAGRLKPPFQTPSLVLYQFQHDGSLDETYGSRGKWQIESEHLSYLSWIRNLLEDDEGKVWFVMNHGLYKRNQDGTPDTEVGAEGYVNIHGMSAINDATVMPDDSLTLLGMQQGDVLLSRILPNGVVDARFGDQGLQPLRIRGKARDRIYLIRSTPAGQLLLAGYVADGEYDARGSFWVGRVHANGARDTTFGMSMPSSVGGIVPFRSQQTQAVVLDDDVFIHDADFAALNDGLGNYQGLILEIVRAGGADPDDVFMAQEPLHFLGSDAYFADRLVGAVTHNAGKLTLSITQPVSQYDINRIASSMLYRNTGDFNQDSNISMSWVLRDHEGNISAPASSEVSLIGNLMHSGFEGD